MSPKSGHSLWGGRRWSMDHGPLKSAQTFLLEPIIRLRSDQFRLRPSLEENFFFHPFLFSLIPIPIFLSVQFKIGQMLSRRMRRLKRRWSIIIDRPNKFGKNKNSPKNNGNDRTQLLLLVALVHRLALLLLLVDKVHSARANFSWPRARVPFEDDPRLLVDPDQAVALNNARMDLQVRTCIRLVPRHGESDYVHFADLGPHIECWNMFEPFPPKGRILVNAGTSCLEPMRRPHRPRRVFSDCDIEYVNHLYNCPRRRKSSPICPIGRLIMAKPMELHKQQHSTTVAAGTAEEMDMTIMPTAIAPTTTTAEGMEEEEEEEERTHGPDEGEGDEWMNTTTMETTQVDEDGEEEQQQVAQGRDRAAQSVEGVEEIVGTWQQRTVSTTLTSNWGTESTGKEAEIAVDEVLEMTMSTIGESVEHITTEQSQQQQEMTTIGEETMPERSSTTTTAIPGTERETNNPEMTEAAAAAATNWVTEPTMAMNTIYTPQPIITMPKMTRETIRTTTTTVPSSSTAEQQWTSPFPWTAMPSSTPSATWLPLVFTDWTVSSATDQPTITTATDVPLRPQAETDAPLRHPFPLMMTLITTTTTTTIAPPPPDWVRSVEESFRVGDESVDRTMKSTTIMPGIAERRSSSSTSEEKPKPRGDIGPPKPTPIRPESEQSGEGDPRPSRPVMVGLIQLPSGSGLAIRERTKITKVIEKTKYIGPCGSACHYDGQLTRLYRSVNNDPSVMDHFYTTERLEQHLMAAQGFVMESSSMGFLGRNQIDPNCTCTRPLHRLYSEFAKDHFLTVSEQEKSIAEALLGYVHERTLGYCTNEPGCGAYVPLYRFFSAVNRDHFYTADQQEMHYYKTHSELTYVFEKIECYVWQHSASARGCPAVPLLDEREQRERDDDVKGKADEFRRRQRQIK